MKKAYISSKDIEELLQRRGVETKRTGSYVNVKSARGSVFFQADADLDPISIAQIRKWLNQIDAVSYQEFDTFIAEKYPLLEKVIKQGKREKTSENAYSEVKDSQLRQRLVKLGSAPLDTIIRESGVILEDRLRQAANATDTSDLHGVALIDALLAPGKAKIIFSTHPGEQDGARMLYRGAMQYIRNPAMHKLIEYQKDEARVFISILDNLLQLLSEATSVESTKSNKK